MVEELAAHAASVLLHALEAVQDDQVRLAVAQAALEALEAAARGAFVLAEEELVALAEEGIGVGPLIERPHEDVRGSRLEVADEALDDDRLAGTAGRVERPHAVRRGQVPDPGGQLFHERLAPVEVWRGLKGVNDAELALPGLG